LSYRARRKTDALLLLPAISQTEYQKEKGDYR
jgi:hypothetical protein